jgi:TPR repeat protein
MNRASVAIVMSVLASGALMMSTQAAAPDPRAERLWQQAINAPNPYQEFPLLLEAAQLGHPRAEAAVGSYYQRGQGGVREDDAQAAYWFQQAAAQGNRGAQFNLAGMYTMGQGGLSVDLRKAAELLTASARQGYAPAQLALGISYEFAEGVARNRQAATYWLDQAAAQGDQSAATISRVLKDPRTPQFQSEVQLGNYLIGQQRGPANGAHGCVPNLNWNPYGHTDVGPMTFCR